MKDLKINELAQEVKAGVLFDLFNAYDCGFDSPLEKYFFYSFLDHCISDSQLFPSYSGGCPFIEFYMAGGISFRFYSQYNVYEEITKTSSSPNEVFELYFNRKIKYRIDFVLKVVEEKKNITKKIALEIDGHDFHEKTKEQAKKDKERDRYLQKQGYIVFRYTGSEIYGDVNKAIKDILKFIENGLWRDF